MTNKIRNVTKQLLGAEDVLFGRGTVNQRRGPADVSIHRLDLALPVADEAELAVTDPEQYPKASIGSRNFVAVNGQYQEVSTIQPVLFNVGAMMSAEYPYAVDGDTVAKWTGAFPKTLTLADQGFTNPGWQVTSTGLGRAIISETVPSASFTREGVRWYKPSELTTYVYYCDGDSCQWVQEPVQSAEGTLRQELENPSSSVTIGGVAASQLAIYSNLVKETFVTPELFGAVGDGIAVDALAIKQWLESPLKKVARRDAVYSLGLLSGDSALAETTGINHDIDFNFAKFVCSGATDGVYTATTMLKVTNGKLAVRNLAGFNDLNFASRGAGRGVVPWIIVNDGVSTEGYLLENIVLDNCQSFGTFVSSNPDNQARGINIGAGCVIKGNCERGITLSDSGSNVKGVFTINGTVNRDIFASNVSDVDLLIYGGIAQPSSGNILIVAGAGRTVSGINLTLKNEQIYSASIIAAGSDSVLKDINIDIWSETIGDPDTEVIRLGAQDGSGNWLTTSDFSSSNVSLKIRSNTKQFLEFGMQSRSPNVEPVKLYTYGNYTWYKQGVGTYFDLNEMSYFANSLSSNAVPISFNTNKIQKNISNIGYEVYVKASGGGAQQDAKYLVTAFKNSDGDLVAFNSSLIYALNVGGVSSAISASGPNINVTFSGFSGAINAMVVVKRLEF